MSFMVGRLPVRPATRLRGPSIGMGMGTGTARFKSPSIDSIQRLQSRPSTASQFSTASSSQCVRPTCSGFFLDEEQAARSPGKLRLQVRLFSQLNANGAGHKGSSNNNKERRKNREGEDEKDKRELLQELEEPNRNQSPASGERSAESMTKGKLLTTPSRLFKLIIPLTTLDHADHHKDIEPIALLVHPQQPLSYLERLIQSEVPPIQGENGQLRPPAISFIALQLEDSAIKPKRAKYQVYEEDGKEDSGSGPGPVERRRRSREEDAEKYVYLRRSEQPGGEDKETQQFVRWSQSTEIGDFIRDAARAREFIVTIEGAPTGLGQIRVAVPSFNERTYFLRMRLRKISRRIKDIAEVKHECDVLAHRGAQRVAIGGFGILGVWWYLVYRLTFETDLGWDTMEPVTYLASLSTLMGGYLWFLYHNREISYRSALDFTISARQKKLYQMKSVDLNLWESLIDEGNSLRKEIKNIAAEYDVDWDERADEQDERVTEALKKERHHKHANDEDSGGKSKDSDD